MNAKHPLGALIDQAKQANGWSDVDVANRAKARGHTLSKSNVARIRNEPVTTLVGKQLLALADGLGVPVQQLAAAGLESMGIPGYTASATDAEQAVRLDPTLPEHVRRTLVTIIRNERDRHLGDPHGSGTEEVQEPRTQAGSEEYSREAGGGRSRRSPSMNESANPDYLAARKGYTPEGSAATDDKQGDYELARRHGETEERRHRRLIGDPWDQPDPDGPEEGA